MNLNKAFVLGRLTADPQLRTIPSGQSVATFAVATNRIWNDKAGAKQEQVEYHNVVVWGRQAEIASQFLKKGAIVLVEGRLQSRTWQSREGHNMKTTEIIAERLQFGPRAFGGDGRGQAPARAGESQEQAAKEELPTINIDEAEIKPEDLPF